MKHLSHYTIIAALASLFIIGGEVLAQRDVPRYEIGGQFSLLALNGPSSQDSISLSDYFDNPCKGFDLKCRRVALGFGARFTYNLTKHIALEAAGNFFPARPLSEFGRVHSGRRSCGPHLSGPVRRQGRQAFKKIGSLSQFRPGFVGFTQASHFTGFKIKSFFHPTLGRDVLLENAEFRIGKATYLSADLGGVVEFYPSAAACDTS